MAPPPPPPPAPPPPGDVDEFLTNGLDEQPQSEGAVALPSFGTGDTNGPMDTTPPAPPEKEPQVWEKPLTVPNIRKSSSNWSLASDAGLLLYLQEFSHKMLTKTSELEKKMDGLVHETKCTDSRVHNVFNDFLMLANTQFIENRVYDDSEETDQKPEAANKKEDQAKTREQREAEVIPRVIKALNLGINVLDTAFEQLDANVGNSDSEEEDATYRAVVEPILEPKDLYAHRALPFLIGSPAFMQDDNVGVADITEEEMSEEGSVSGSEKTTSESESEYTDETESESEVESDVAAKQKKPSQREKSQSESEGDLFDQDEEKSSDNEEDEKPKGGAFASELAARIGAAPPGKAEDEETKRERTVSEVSTASSKGKKRKKGAAKGKAGKRRSASKTSEDNMFDEPAAGGEDDDESSPFGKKGGLFSSSGGGLFGDDEEEEGGLFDEAPKPRSSSRKEDHIYEDIAAGEVETPKTKSGKKVPAGAVPLFSDPSAEDDLFGSSPKSNEAGKTLVMRATSAAKDRRPSMENSRKKKQGAEKAAPKVEATAASGGLFDEDEDDGGLFGAPAATKAPKKEATKKTVDLFDDEEEEGGLFGGGSADKPAAATTAPRQRADSAKKKLPAGAVSMFGTVDPLAAKRASVSHEEVEEKEETKPSPPPVAKKGSKPTMEKKTDIFDEEEGDLFAENSKSKPAPTKAPTKGSLFGDEEGDEDGLFAGKETIHVPPAAKTAPAKKPDMKKKASAGSLFDDIEGDEEDDLFGATSKPKEAAKKKPVGGVALFGDADMFSTSPKKEGTEEKEAPIKKRDKAPKSRTTLSLFDDDEQDDQLFEAGPPKKEDLGPRHRTKSKSVFDDEDVLFNIKEEAPPVDLFGATSPVTATKPDSNLDKPRSASSASKNLFSDEDEDDLFGAAAKATPKTATKAQPAKKAETSAKPRASSKVDLFGDDEGDGDDLFGGGGAKPSPAEVKAKPAAPEVKSKPSPPEVKTKPDKKDDVGVSSGPAPGDPLLGDQSPSPAAKPKKPAGAVSMFGGFDPSAITRQISSGSIKEEDKDEEANVKPTRTPSTSSVSDNISPKPFSAAASSSKPASVIKSVKPPSAKVGGKRISMLQLRLPTAQVEVLTPQRNVPSSSPTLKPKVCTATTQTPPPRPTVPPARSLSPPARSLSPPTRPLSPPARPHSPLSRSVSPPTRPLSPPVRSVSPPARPLSPPPRPQSPPARPHSPVSPLTRLLSPPARPQSPPFKPLTPAHRDCLPQRPGSPLRPISPPPLQNNNSRFEIILPKAVKKCLKVIDNKVAKKMKNAQAKQAGLSTECADLEKASKRLSNGFDEVPRQHRINRNNNSPTSPDKLRSRHPSDPSSLKRRQHARLKFSPSDALFTVSSKALAISPRLFQKDTDREPKCLPLTSQETRHHNGLETRPPPQRPTAPPPRAPPPPLRPGAYDSTLDWSPVQDTCTYLGGGDCDLRTSVLPDLPIHASSRRASPRPQQSSDLINGLHCDPPHKPCRPPLSPHLATRSPERSRVNFSPCPSPSPPASPVGFSHRPHAATPKIPSSPRLPGRRQLHPPRQSPTPPLPPIPQAFNQNHSGNDGPPEIPRRLNQHPLPSPPPRGREHQAFFPRIIQHHVANGTQSPALPPHRRLLPPVPSSEPHHGGDVPVDMVYSPKESGANEGLTASMNDGCDQSRPWFRSAFKNKSKHVRFVPGREDTNHVEHMRAFPQTVSTSVQIPSLPFLDVKPLPPIPHVDAIHPVSQKDCFQASKPLPSIPSFTHNHVGGHLRKDSPHPIPHFLKDKPLPPIPKDDSKKSGASSANLRNTPECVSPTLNDKSHQRHKALPEIPQHVPERPKKLNLETNLSPGVPSVSPPPRKAQLSPASLRKHTPRLDTKAYLQDQESLTWEKLQSCPVESNYSLDNQDHHTGNKFNNLRKNSRSSSKFFQPPSGDQELLRKMEKRKAAIELSISKASMNKKNHLKSEPPGGNCQKYSADGGRGETVMAARKDKRNEELDLFPQRQVQNTGYFQYPDPSCGSIKTFATVADQKEGFLPERHPQDSEGANTIDEVARHETDSDPETSPWMHSPLPRAPPPPPPPPLPPREAHPLPTTTSPPKLPPRSSPVLFTNNREKTTSDTTPAPKSHPVNGGRSGTRIPPSPLPRPNAYTISQRKRSDQRITSPTPRCFSPGIPTQRLGSTSLTSSPCQGPGWFDSAGQSELMAKLERKRAQIESGSFQRSPSSSFRSSSKRPSPPVRSQKNSKNDYQSLGSGESELMAKLAKKREAIDRAPSANSHPGVEQERKPSEQREGPIQAQSTSTEQSELMQKLERKRAQAESRPVSVTDTACLERESQTNGCQQTVRYLDRMRNPSYSQEASVEQSELMQKLARKRTEAEPRHPGYLEADKQREDPSLSLGYSEHCRNQSSSQEPCGEQSELIRKLERKQAQAESKPISSSHCRHENETPLLSGGQKVQEQCPLIDYPKQRRNPSYNHEISNEQSELMQKLARKRAQAEPDAVSSRQVGHSSQTSRPPPVVPPKNSRSRNRPLCLSPTKVESDANFPQQNQRVPTKGFARNISPEGSIHRISGHVKAAISTQDESIVKPGGKKTEAVPTDGEIQETQRFSNVPFPEMTFSSLPWRPTKKVKPVNFSPRSSLSRQSKRNSGTGSAESEVPKVTRRTKNVRKVPSRRSRDFQKLVSPLSLRSANANPGTLSSSKLMNKSADETVTKVNQGKPLPSTPAKKPVRARVRRKPSDKHDPPPHAINLRKKSSMKRPASKRLSLKVRRNSKTLSPSLPQDSLSKAPCAPKTLPKPTSAKRVQAARLLGSAVGRAASPPPPIRKGTTSNSIEKIQSSMAIDPTAMRPGASPPSREVEPEGVSFDEPPKLQTLSSLNKGRAKVSTKRRAPSRHLRREGASIATGGSSGTVTDGPGLLSTSPGSPPKEDSPPPALPDISSGPLDTGDIFPSETSASITKPKDKDIPSSDFTDFSSPLGFTSSGITLPPSSSDNKPKAASSDMFGNDDLFGTGPPPAISAPLTTRDDEEDPLFATAPKKTEKTKAKSPLDIDEDLFAPKKPETDKKALSDPFADNLFGEGPETKKQGKKSGKAKEAAQDDDLFASDTPKKETKPSSVPLLEDDDLFASSPSPKAKKKKETKKEVKKAELDDDDDLFAEKKPAAKKTKSKKPDSDLFSDNTNIFDDIPSAKPKEKKKKKDSALFTEPAEGDIFASPTSSKPKKAKTKKKTTEKKPVTGDSIFDESAPNIFDDPLNAMGN